MVHKSLNKKGLLNYFKSHQWDKIHWSSIAKQASFVGELPGIIVVGKLF